MRPTRTSPSRCLSRRKRKFFVWHFPPYHQTFSSPAKQPNKRAQQNVAQSKKKQAIKRQQNNGGKVQKRSNVRRGDVAIKISNRGPSGWVTNLMKRWRFWNNQKLNNRSTIIWDNLKLFFSRGKGRVNVVRDTLKKEKPATSLDDRFSQLLKSASRTANRSRGGGAGRKVSAGGAKRGGGANRRGGAPRSNRRY